MLFLTQQVSIRAAVRSTKTNGNKVPHSRLRLRPYRRSALVQKCFTRPIDKIQKIRRLVSKMRDVQHLDQLIHFCPTQVKGIGSSNLLLARIPVLIKGTFNVQSTIPRGKKQTYQQITVRPVNSSKVRQCVRRFADASPTHRRQHFSQ